MKFVRHIMTLAAALLTTAAVAQTTRVKAWLDSTYVIVGSPTTIHLEAMAPEGVAVDFPQLDPRGIRAVDDTVAFLLEYDTPPHVDTLRSDNGMVTMREDITVFAFDSASLLIPSFAFAVRGDTLRTNELAMKVVVPFEEVEVDPQKFFDIKDVMSPEFVIWDYAGWVLWPLLAVLVLAAAYFGYEYYRRHRADAPAVEKKETPLPPHVVALAALEALAAKKLWQNGQQKQYHTELADILRTYIEGRFRVPAMEKTTGEIVDELYELSESQQSSLTSLKQVLSLADLVKFAKYEALPDENQLSHVNAQMFVTQTQETTAAPDATPDVSDTDKND